MCGQKSSRNSSRLIDLNCKETIYDSELFACRFSFHSSTPLSVQNMLFVDREEGFVSLNTQSRWNETSNELTFTINVTRADDQNCEYT